MDDSARKTEQRLRIAVADTQTRLRIHGLVPVAWMAMVDERPWQPTIEDAARQAGP